LGAMAAGCQFISSYPMTPASSIVEHMAEQAGVLPLVFEQAEDEIAGINMAVGASYTGLRSMVATSGGGFSLMVEGLSLAGCTETPVVVVMGQRPGPATGLATRTEQGELLFCLHAGHGEFPRAILAPGNAEEAFWLAVKAFNLAERYQTPVFLLTDQHLADSYYTVEPFDLSRVTIDRGELVGEDDLERMELYPRYAITPGGVSPRAFPGQTTRCVMSTGNEHDEYGWPTEDKDMRKRMVNKRLAKAKGLAREIRGPVVHGSNDPDTVLLTWGSSFGACREATDILNAQGERVRMVHMPEVWPFPRRDTLKAIGTPARLVSVEMNATGQLGRLLRQETGVQPDFAVLRYDGRPMNGPYVAKTLQGGGQYPW